MLKRIQIFFTFFFVQLTIIPFTKYIWNQNIRHLYARYIWSKQVFYLVKYKASYKYFMLSPTQAQSSIPLSGILPLRSQQGQRTNCLLYIKLSDKSKRPHEILNAKFIINNNSKCIAHLVLYQSINERTRGYQHTKHCNDSLLYTCDTKG